ncbi:transporter [Niabella ginsenosidivorans]|uniref:Transporter n=1 Tax=Niabella ginsenosidivorans TaxID=1176587 RepID=A0A1A9I9T3_9BACT|nr:transporter [Niabella ginsenosidivorans]
MAFLVVCCLAHRSSAQTDKLTLDECYRLARANYPAIKKMNLITRASAYDIQNANKRFLPQVNFSGQATYQSQTVNFSDAVGTLPGVSFPSVSKDQYRVQGEVSQLLYDGNNTRYQKELITADKDLQEQNLETGLYAIKNRINNIYFSVLLMEAQLKQNELNKANLQTQVQKTEAALENGTAFRSSLDELKAEIVNIEMAGTEYRANRIACLKMLSLFIGKELQDSIQLEIPETTNIQTSINRPELKLYDLQRSVYDVQRKQLRSGYLPQVSAFLQGAYGRPTLNIIDNKFGPWYVAGLKFNWSLGSLYSLANKKNMLILNQRSVDTDRETFLLNTRLDLTQQDEQVKKFTELIQQDEEAIALRAAVTRSAEAQLNNGVITIHEYIQKVNAEHLARQNELLHKIQLLQARYNQKFISGN